jgi:hypothetical protein
VTVTRRSQGRRHRRSVRCRQGSRRPPPAAATLPARSEASSRTVRKASNRCAQQPKHRLVQVCGRSSAASTRERGEGRQRGSLRRQGSRSGAGRHRRGCRSRPGCQDGPRGIASCRYGVTVWSFAGGLSAAAVVSRARRPQATRLRLEHRDHVRRRLHRRFRRVLGRACRPTLQRAGQNDRPAPDWRAMWASSVDSTGESRSTWIALAINSS